jgi:hypothetical protein
VLSFEVRNTGTTRSFEINNIQVEDAYSDIFEVLDLHRATRLTHKAPKFTTFVSNRLHALVKFTTMATKLKQNYTLKLQSALMKQSLRECVFSAK